MHVDIASIPSLVWLPVSTAAILLLVQIIKKSFKMDNKHAVRAVSAGVSALVAIVPYYLEHRGLSAKGIVSNSFDTFGASQVLYGICKFIQPYLPSISLSVKKIEQAEANNTDESLVNNEVVAALTPQTVETAPATVAPAAQDGDLSF